MTIKPIDRYSKKKLSAVLPISVLLAVLFLSSLMPPSAFSIQPPVNTSEYYLQRVDQPKRVDPSTAFDLTSRELIQNVYEPLIFFSDKPVPSPDTGDVNYSAHPELVADLSQFGPMLATEVPTVNNSRITNDGKDWRFTINTSATFQPWKDHNGNQVPATALTAADVEYTFERMLAQDMSSAPSWMIALPGTGYMYYDDFDANPATRQIEPPENETKLGSLIDDFVTTGGNDVIFHFATAPPITAMYQIFAHTCSCIVSKAFCIEHGCWNDSFAPGWSFFRRYPTNGYSPLDRWVPTSRYTNDAAGNKNGWGNGDVPAMIGTGPYKFTAWDKANRVWRIDYYPAYWRGWADAGNHGGVPGVSFLVAVVWRVISSWPTMKMMFLLGYFDECTVPPSKEPELELSKDRPIPGFRLYYNMPALKNEAMLFCFNVDPTSLYQSKILGSVVPDFFNNTHVRAAFCHSLNFSEYYSGEGGIHQASWWVDGLKPDYKNKSLVPHDIDIAKIQAELQQAYFPQGGGQSVWDTGFETYLVYNLGNDKRKFLCEMISQIFTALGSKYKCKVIGLDLDVILDALEKRKLPTFIVNLQADIADADNFARPYMYSSGEFAYFQGYNDTHVDYLIDLGITQPDEIADPPPDYPIHTNRNGTYQELQYIYWRDYVGLPLVQPVERRWSRDWVKGWYYNQLYPGDYFYDLYKSAAAGGAVDLDVVHSITPYKDANRTTLIFLGQMRIGNTGGLGQPASGNANPQTQYWNISVLYKLGGEVDPVIASLGLKRNSSQTGYAETQYPNGTWCVLSPGQINWTVFQWWEDGVAQTVKADYSMDRTSHSGTPYTISGESYPVIGTESNPADNLVIASPNTYWNASRLNGDVNGNGVVDIYDAILLSNSFGRVSGEAKYNAGADFDANGEVDIYDAITLSNNFGKHVP